MVKIKLQYLLKLDAWAAYKENDCFLGLTLRKNLHILEKKSEWLMVKMKLLILKKEEKSSKI